MKQATKNYESQKNQVIINSRQTRTPYSTTLDFTGINPTHKMSFVGIREENTPKITRC